jgi:hypothetical protein
MTVKIQIFKNGVCIFVEWQTDKVTVSKIRAFPKYAIWEVSADSRLSIKLVILGPKFLVL